MSPQISSGTRRLLERKGCRKCRRRISDPFNRSVTCFSSQERMVEAGKWSPDKRHFYFCHFGIFFFFLLPVESASNKKKPTSQSGWAILIFSFKSGSDFGEKSRSRRARAEASFPGTLARLERRRRLGFRCKLCMTMGRPSHPPPFRRRHLLSFFFSRFSFKQVACEEVGSWQRSFEAILEVNPFFPGPKK